MTCPSCGEPTGAGDSFCESCGAELAPPRASTSGPGYQPQCPVCSVDPAAPPGGGLQGGRPPGSQQSGGLQGGRPPGSQQSGGPQGGRPPGSQQSGISADGYCESCGRKVPTGRDHSELDLGLLAGVSDRGLRHPRNEDAMALATARAPGGPVAIAVVCDGVSSSPRPDQASLAAAQAAVRVLLASARCGDDPAEASAAAMRSAHRVLTGLGSPSQAPSTTYVSAIIGGDAVTACWVGDSRAYWLAPGDGARRLTEDDSIAQQMVASGQMAEAEAMASPQAHVITRWLGADVADPRPHVTRFEPPGAGAVLICSDGLWNYLSDAAELAGLALPAALTDPLGAASALVKFALDAGGADNITVVLVPFPPRSQEISP